MTKPLAHSASIPYEKLGPPGIRSELYMLAIMDNELRKDDDRLRDVTLRQFKINARLAKSPPVVEDIQCDFTAEDGSSFLLFPESAEFTHVDSPDGRFEFKKNSLGEHSVIEFKCEALTAKEARQKFLLVVLPFLDYITYCANSPLIVAALRIEDLKNHCVTVEYISPYRKATVTPHSWTLLPELMPVYAMYREAKNSSSDFYKFLCYHKILDGLYGTMRTALFQRAKESNIILDGLRELVPDSADIDLQYRDYVGKPVKKFLDTILTPRLRNAVAHFITDDGAVLNMSSSEHIDTYAGVLLITELCVRTAIDSYQQMLIQLLKQLQTRQ